MEHDTKSGLEDALTYVEERAPTDVLQTMAWMESAGWEPVVARGGRSFGNVLIEWAQGGNRVTVTLDRGQWLLDVQPAGWKERFDLQVIAEAVTGLRDDGWDGDALPEKIPWSVSWSQTLPLALVWLATTDGAEAELRSLQRQRASRVFPKRTRRVL